MKRSNLLLSMLALAIGAAALTPAMAQERRDVAPNHRQEMRHQAAREQHRREMHRREEHRREVRRHDEHRPDEHR